MKSNPIYMTVPDKEQIKTPKGMANAMHAYIALMMLKFKFSAYDVKRGETEDSYTITIELPK